MSWRELPLPNSADFVDMTGIDTFAASPQTDRVTILLVRAGEHRLNRLKTAVHTAGFRTISVRGLDGEWGQELRSFVNCEVSVEAI